MNSYEEIKAAKVLLKANGYQVDNLWTVGDVQSTFNCTEEEAQEVLYGALTNEATMEQIWFSIQEFGEEYGLEYVDIIFDEV